MKYDEVATEKRFYKNLSELQATTLQRYCNGYSVTDSVAITKRNSVIDSVAKY